MTNLKNYYRIDFKYTFKLENVYCGFILKDFYFSIL